KLFFLMFESREILHCPGVETKPWTRMSESSCSNFGLVIRRPALLDRTPRPPIDGLSPPTRIGAVKLQTSSIQPSSNSFPNTLLPPSTRHRVTSRRPSSAKMSRHDRQ